MSSTSILSNRMKAALSAIVTEHSNGEGGITLTVDQLAAKLAPKEPKQSKKSRDPSKPKHPKSAFLIWSLTIRDEVKAIMESNNDAPGSPKITASDVSNQLGFIWKEMSNNDKLSFKEEAKVARENYAKLMDAYRAENGIEAPSKPCAKFDNSIVPATPTGWHGPFDGYLERHPIDSSTGKHLTKGYKHFDIAVAEAKRLGAGGITMTRVGFRIRMGNTVSTNEASRNKGELSWTIN